jgi:hypothetical protein
MKTRTSTHRCQVSRGSSAAGLIARLVLVVTILGLAAGGCGLGYIEIIPEQYVTFRVENGTAETAQVTIMPTTARLVTDEGLGLGDGGESDVTIGLPRGGVTSGSLLCADSITVLATISGATGGPVELTGAGTGTPGFDSGSVSLTGERHLLANTHFDCDDTILVRLSGASSGEIVVVAASTVLPDPLAPPDDQPELPPEVADSSKVIFRLENATATAADVAVSAIESGTDGEETAPSPVRVPPGAFTTGEVDCGSTLRVTGTMTDTGSSAVLLTGDGTGTIGFDSSSIGLSGERLLVFGEHYACGETIVVRVSDDGSGIGLSTSEMPLGQVHVFSDGETIPEPDLPDPEDLDETPVIEQITLVVANQTESAVQINFATGNGTLASSGGTDVTSQFDVRVPPGAATTGMAVCAQEYMIAGAHLEATATTYSEGGGDIFSGGGGVNYHAIVLTGDGTGTEGFDSSSIAVTRGRLIQLGTHFSCGDVVTVTITATNNQIQYDDEGNPVTDQFGNPTVKYNVGSGFVSIERNN